ncbi:hypothetical protein [Paludibaculum fermentans]|uniref:DNA-binding protein n=1 Tax=Paludibaculum fermentans TaxID=1473598 RepID=A0A7S7SIZ3_PALFE|nr:hypothetical protein [Paludibaculum fermentans]QOY85450.1 hypothetical protein IRI77_21770 [Paludibaculum fermentans]
MTIPRPGKGYYSETEAAQALGLTVDSLRALVRQHILQSEDEMANLPMTTFQPSDLLLLRLLSSSRSQQTTVEVR